VAIAVAVAAAHRIDPAIARAATKTPALAMTFTTVLRPLTANRDRHPSKIVEKSA